MQLQMHECRKNPVLHNGQQSKKGMKCESLSLLRGELSIGARAFIGGADAGRVPPTITYISRTCKPANAVGTIQSPSWTVLTE